MTTHTIDRDRFAIVDSIDGFDPALDSGEREVCDVDFEHKNFIASDRQYRECQVCEYPARWDREHIQAFGRAESEYGHTDKRPAFCSRKWWGERAGNGGKE